jgi:hypothetical protein
MHHNSTAKYASFQTSPKLYCANNTATPALLMRPMEKAKPYSDKSARLLLSCNSSAARDRNHGSTLVFFKSLKADCIAALHPLMARLTPQRQKLLHRGPMAEW